MGTSPSPQQLQQPPKGQPAPEGQLPEQPQGGRQQPRGRLPQDPQPQGGQPPLQQQQQQQQGHQFLRNSLEGLQLSRYRCTSTSTSRWRTTTMCTTLMRTRTSGMWSPSTSTIPTTPRCPAPAPPPWRSASPRVRPSSPSSSAPTSSVSTSVLRDALSARVLLPSQEAEQVIDRV